LISPSKTGRLKIPEHDAKRIAERLPLVGQLKVEAGWIASVVKIGGRKKKTREQTRRDRETPAQAMVTASPTARTPLDLLKQVEALRVQAEKFVGELDVDSPEGYWVGDLNSVLCRLVNQGSQILQGRDEPE
jgi:hypothetical protein